MKKSENQVNIKWSVLIKWCIAITSIWLLSWLLIHFCVDKENVGTFGDQFGAVNALFSGLALAGVIYTLIQQQHEMTAQRREFMVNRAMNSVYRQVDFINKNIDTLYAVRVNMRTADSTEYNGINVLRLWSEENLKTENIQGFLLSDEGYRMNKFLRIFANSCKLLIRQREVEEMDDIDALITYETLRYNIDSRVWDFIKELEKIDFTKITNDKAKYYHYYLELIISFRTEWKLLETKVKNAKKTTV